MMCHWQGRWQEKRAPHREKLPAALLVAACADRASLRQSGDHPNVPDAALARTGTGELSPIAQRDRVAIVNRGIASDRTIDRCRDRPAHHRAACPEVRCSAPRMKSAAVGG